MTDGRVRMTAEELQYAERVASDVLTALVSINRGWTVNECAGHAWLQALAMLAERRRTMELVDLDDQPAYHCKECGSPRWQPGGMGDMYRRCLDCSSIGDKIDEPRDS